MFSWLDEEGARLDAPPFLSDALEARFLLKRLNVRRDKLESLTKGHNRGIFNGPMFSRTFVEDPEYGVPFLGTSSMLQADLSRLPLLSKRAAFSPRLGFLKIEEGMTLVSCSGTIGRTAYVRPEMAGMWSSQDIIKIVPNRDLLSPGYLNAFLSCKFGNAQLTAGTYGAIIQHIEPQHVAGLLVPRLGNSIERKVDKLVTQAAFLRSKASSDMRRVADDFDALIPESQAKRTSPRVRGVSSLLVSRRLDAGFHDPIAESVRRRISSMEFASVGDFCPVVALPGIFKRLYVDDPRYGVPYFTGASLFWLEPLSKGILSKKTSLYAQVLLERGTILVQAFGQEGGLTGRSVWVGEHLDNTCTTHMLIRLRARTVEETAYLYGFLQSESAYRQIATLPFGGSIPNFSEAEMKTVLIPLLPTAERKAIGLTVLKAMKDRDDALSLELEARRLVEAAIEENA
jgi:type I restriction enzyme S subunit